MCKIASGNDVRKTVLNISLKKFEGQFAYIDITVLYRYPRRNVPDFGRTFLMLKYTDITQNTYTQS